ncbi:MAG: M23 family metallopeptidase [Helicobacteraceae bacterium]|jgi:murein DD-endopeptidase MepM/ murein hydrolase activator NlpD|nr:M23 family metallopeptidase [Helicobacteraceae bacterium]
MRDNTTITITTINGSKSYTFGQFVKSIALYILLIFTAIGIVGAASIVFLLGEMDNFEKLKERHKALLITNNDLGADIDKKRAQLTQISEKITDIESLVGMTPQPTEEMRKRLDAAKMGATERMLMLRMVPSGVPIEYRGLTSIFGWRYHPLRRTQREFHTGSDLRAALKTPVYATADGVVDLVRSNENVGFGNLISITHAFGFKSLYAHLDSMVVDQGDFIQKGQLIAYSGNTGYSSGPHLHYEIRYLNKPLDPTAFMEWDLQSYEAIFEREKRVQWDSVAKGITWQWTLLEQLSSQKEPKLQAQSKLSASSTSTGK